MIVCRLVGQLVLIRIRVNLLQRIRQVDSLGPAVAAKPELGQPQRVERPVRRKTRERSSLGGRSSLLLVFLLLLVVVLLAGGVLGCGGAKTLVVVVLLTILVSALSSIPLSSSILGLLLFRTVVAVVELVEVVGVSDGLGAVRLEKRRSALSGRRRGPENKDQSAYFALKS